MVFLSGRSNRREIDRFRRMRSAVSCRRRRLATRMLPLNLDVTQTQHIKQAKQRVLTLSVLLQQQQHTHSELAVHLWRLVEAGFDRCAGVAP